MTTPMISATPLAAAPTPGVPGAAPAAPAAGFGAMLAAALAPAAAPRVVGSAVPVLGRPAEEPQDAAAAPEGDAGGAPEQEPALLDAFLLTNAVTGTVATAAPVVPAQAPAVGLAGLDGAAASQVADPVDGAAALLGAPATDADQPVLPGTPSPAAPVAAAATATAPAPAAPAVVPAARPEPGAPVVVPADASALTAPADPASVLPAPVVADEPATPVAAPVRAEAPAPLAPVAPVSAPAAPAAVTPAAPVVPVTPAAIVDQIAPHVTSLAESGPGVHRLSLTLDPAELGQVRVVLVQRHDEMHVVISASEGARAALQQGSPELRRLLDAVGLPEARVTITDSGAGGTTDQRGTQSGGGDLREQAAPRTFAPAPAVAPRAVGLPAAPAPVPAAAAAGVDLTI